MITILGPFTVNSTHQLVPYSSSGSGRKACMSIMRHRYRSSFGYRRLRNSGSTECGYLLTLNSHNRNFRRIDCSSKTSPADQGMASRLFVHVTHFWVRGAFGNLKRVLAIDGGVGCRRTETSTAPGRLPNS